MPTENTEGLRRVGEAKLILMGMPKDLAGKERAERLELYKQRLEKHGRELGEKLLRLDVKYFDRMTLVTDCLLFGMDSPELKSSDVCKEWLIAFIKKNEEK